MAYFLPKEELLSFTVLKASGFVCTMAIRKHLRNKYDDTPALERYKILDAIKNCQNLRDKALIAFLYLSGARVREVLRLGLKENPKLKPIMKKQIEIRDDVIMIQNVRILKVRDSKARRSIPIIINKVEEPFINILMEYLGTIQDDDGYLFEISKQRAGQILEEVGLYPHLLRHARMTHLVTDYDFQIPQMMQFTGWKRTQTAAIYTHLNVGDLVDKMRKPKVF